MYRGAEMCLNLAVVRSTCCVVVVGAVVPPSPLHAPPHTRSISRLTSAAVQVSARARAVSSRAPGLRTARCGTVGQLEATCQFVLLPTPSRELEGGWVELLEQGRAASDGDGRVSGDWPARARAGGGPAAALGARAGGGPVATYGYAARGKAASPSEQSLPTSSNVTQCMSSRRG